MIPKRRKRQRSGIRDDDGPLRCPGHLQWVRGHECAVSSAHCRGKIVAAHVRMGYVAGVGQKPPDDRTVPLCWLHHEEQHKGEKTFWKWHGKDPIALAKQLAARSPALRRYRMREEDE